MAETIDEATIIAWVDGELGEAEELRIAQAVAADPDLAALADRHRHMKARFAAAFGPIAHGPAATAPVSSPVISLAAARAERDAKAAKSPRLWWGVSSAIAASLLVGVFVGHGFGDGSGVADKPNALALAGPIAKALNGQLSGDGGVVRVVLSFKDRDGHYCRSFVATNLSGIACRDTKDWQLRYASPGAAQRGDYRMAGGDAAQVEVVAAMIAGEPLDSGEEEAARKAGWK